MAGVYIHIPFCKQLCSYCDFHFSVSLLRRDDMLEALLYEIGARNGEIAAGEATTLYFGGGTPSLYSPRELQKLADRVCEVYGVERFDEVTVEANPEDLTVEYLAGLRETCVNRLSIGVQSFDDRRLSLFNRRHNASTAYRSVVMAKEAGFTNITVDLIYGVPGMTAEEWESDINKFLSLEIPHLSAYHLTIEPKTILGKKASRGEFSIADDDLSALHYEILERETAKAGYRHYEVSNFALDGCEAIHNSGYWNGTPYIGIGPSAHSYDGVSARRWNVSSNAAYLRELSQGGYYETENLTEENLFNEYIMTSLRRSEGLSLSHTLRNFGDIRTEALFGAAEPLVKEGLLCIEGERMFIPTEKFLLSDRVLRNLFI